ncbi:imidazole glycerol phosphate synthase subunit HisH [Magnetococcales bacterium HHB-1]
MSVLIIDYGAGNLRSVLGGIEALGGEGFISASPDDILDADRLILPGVGAFQDGMNGLIQGGWIEPLRHAVFKEDIPLLGICLGMQLLADYGEERGGCDGLGFIPGQVKQLKPQDHNERIPHVGWNEVNPQNNSPLFEGVAPGGDFYFVHSFHFVPDKDENIAAKTPYCGGFISAIQRENILATQFHPEKSSHLGAKVLQNFLSW